VSELLTLTALFLHPGKTLPATLKVTSPAADAITVINFA
jgi:hypothetical protein